MDRNNTNDMTYRIDIQSTRGTDFILSVFVSDNFKRHVAFIEDQTDSSGNKIHCSDFLIINYPDSLQNQIMNAYSLEDLQDLAREGKKSLEEIEYIEKHMQIADEQLDKRVNRITTLFLNKHIVKEKREFDFVLEAENNTNTNNDSSTPVTKKTKAPFMPSLKETSFTPDPNAPGFDLFNNRTQFDCSNIDALFEQNYPIVRNMLKSLLLKLPSNNYKIGDKVVYIKDYDIMVEENNTYLLLGENSVTKKNADGDIVEFRFDKIDTDTKFRIIRLMRCISLKLKLELAQGGLH